MIKLTKEELKIFRELSSKSKNRFWQGETPLMSDRARYILSKPHLSKQLIKLIRESRKNESNT